jgi:hypothetical protein
MANTEGLQKTLEHIKEHPGEWNQGSWSTCFAGASLRVLKGAVVVESTCCRLCDDLEIDGSPIQGNGIATLAQEALGLTDEQRSVLFNGNNDLERITALVAEFTAEQVPA